MTTPEALAEHRLWQLRAPAGGFRGLPEAAGRARGSHADSNDGGSGETAWRSFSVRAANVHGDALVASFEGIADRDAAAALRHFDVGLPREALGAADEGEYFWVDLVGLEVSTCEGVRLGYVHSLLETGANDVLVVRGERERLIPFLPGAVVTQVAIDGEQAGIVVDWDPDF